jgi:hypothetical protein
VSHYGVTASSQAWNVDGESDVHWTSEVKGPAQGHIALGSRLDWDQGPSRAQSPGDFRREGSLISRYKGSGK